MLRDSHQAEEVTQEIFLQAWQTCPHFDPARGSAHTWLMTLAHRRAVDRVRSSEATRRRDHAFASDRSHSAAAPADGVVAAAEREQLVKALAGLSELQREALELSYFGGHTHVEVACRLGIPLGTAKWRIREGLRQLRQALLPDPGAPQQA